jgi:hypothetical protein
MNSNMRGRYMQGGRTMWGAHDAGTQDYCKGDDRRCVKVENDTVDLAVQPYGYYTQIPCTYKFENLELKNLEDGRIIAGNNYPRVGLY